MGGQEQKFDDIRCVGRANSVLISSLQILEQDLGGRAGGYLCVADRKGLPVFLLRMGEVPEDKLNQYHTNALEKAMRLSYTYAYGGYTLSRHSRDENRQRWTGSVLGNLWIWSFSGFPEDCDEVFMVALALGYGDISHHRALVLLRAGEVDENPHFKKVDSLLHSLADIR